MRREKMKKKKSIWKRIVLGVLLVIKMKFKQGKRKTFNRIRQVAKRIANIRFDSYPRVICKKGLRKNKKYDRVRTELTERGERMRNN